MAMIIVNVIRRLRIEAEHRLHGAQRLLVTARRGEQVRQPVVRQGGVLNERVAEPITAFWATRDRLDDQPLERFVQVARVEDVHSGFLPRFALVVPDSPPAGLIDWPAGKVAERFAAAERWGMAHRVVPAAELDAAVKDANKAVSKAESIRKFVILPVDWTEETGELTPSLKLKRNVVMREFRDDVEALYTRPVSPA